MNEDQKKEVSHFLAYLGRALKDDAGVKDAIDVLRIAYHERRQERKHSSDMMFPSPWGPIMTARGGYARQVEKELPLKQVIDMLEAAPIRPDLLGGLMGYIERLEDNVQKLEIERNKALQAKKVVELPDEARTILNELATFDESKEEAKTVRRTVRRLSEEALKFTAPLIVNDDRPNED